MRFRRAFTVVELLVVIAIIGMLVTLLLPAVQAAREAARRTQCLNNLKQISLAILNYESIHRVLPEGGLATDTGGYGHSWWLRILPVIEEQGIYGRFDKDAHYTGWVGGDNWGGNKENLRGQFLSRESLFLYALKTHRPRKSSYPIAFAAPEHEHLTIFHHTSPKVTKNWISSVKPALV